MTTLTTIQCEKCGKDLSLQEYGRANRDNVVRMAGDHAAKNGCDYPSLNIEKFTSLFRSREMDFEQSQPLYSEVKKEANVVEPVKPESHKEPVKPEPIKVEPPKIMTMKPDVKPEVKTEKTEVKPEIKK